jgi:hypothetical protein
MKEPEYLVRIGLLSISNHSPGKASLGSKENEKTISRFEAVRAENS